MKGEQKEKQKRHDSQGSAAAAIGVTVSQIRWAKKAGAPGFGKFEIDEAPLKDWFARQGKLCGDKTTSTNFEDKNALECRKLRLQCEAIEAATEREEQGHVTLEEHHGVLAEAIGSFQTAIYNLTGTLPPDLAGLSLPDIEARLVSAFDAVFLNVKNREN